MRNLAIAVMVMTVVVIPWRSGENPDAALAAETTTPSGFKTGLPAEATQALVAQSMKLAPLAFTMNMGQWDEQVHFRAHAGQMSMWIAADGVYFQFTRRGAQSKEHLDTLLHGTGFANEDESRSNPYAFDAGSDGTVNVADAVYLITYIFKGGPEPCCP